MQQKETIFQKHAQKVAQTPANRSTAAMGVRTERLKWPRRPERGREQKRAEQEDEGRTTNGAGGPHARGPRRALAAKLERKLARAKRERRDHRDGDGGAKRHGEG